MSEPEQKTVMVVDDEDDVRNYLAFALRQAGFKVLTASDGFDALEKAKESRPDLISLDLVMPKQSGVRFYRELSKDKELAKIPILIVTAHARDDLGKADLKELMMSGPGVYLEKPVKPNNYIAAVKRIIGMDTSKEEQKIADTIELQGELKNKIDDADPETLQKIIDLLE